MASPSELWNQYMILTEVQDAFPNLKEGIWPYGRSIINSNTVRMHIFLWPSFLPAYI